MKVWAVIESDLAHSPDQVVALFLHENDASNHAKVLNDSYKFGGRPFEVQCLEASENREPISLEGELVGVY